MHTAGLLSGPPMLCTTLRSCGESMDCAAARNWAGLTVLKSVQRQFLLIWLNQRRQMQPIHNSCNLWILRWALTYITMTSKHNFWGFVFSLFLLLSSCVFLCVPVSPAATWFSSPPTTTTTTTPAAVWKSHVCANKINEKVTVNEKSYFGIL